LVSYSAIALIGGFMLWKAIKTARLKHDHSHDHGDEHGHAEGHSHHEGCHACDAAASPKGVSGWLALAVGSVPCTGALLVLLFGMANGLLVPAILMVVAISLGMALAMSGIGVLAIAGRNLVDRKLKGDIRRHEKFVNSARVVAAAMVLLIGCGLFALTLSLDEPIQIAEETVSD
jgi:ABC-type nickel/cobalt efflux system permease component RcnA